MTVVSDTSPLRYLTLLAAEDLLPRLFGKVFCPASVCGEATHPSAPAALRQLMTAPPAWLVIEPDVALPDGFPLRLDPGESAAIALAESLGAQLLLMDERKGRQAAVQRGLAVAGTINIIAEAAARGWLDYDTTILRLRSQTNFRVSDRIVALAKRLTSAWPSPLL